MIFARRTLFWKYAAYFSGLVSALLILGGGVGGYFAYRESTVALEALQRAKAEAAASEIANFIGRLADDLQSIATKFNTSGAVDEEDLRVELVTLLRHQPSIPYIGQFIPHAASQLIVGAAAVLFAGFSVVLWKVVSKSL